MSHFVLRFFLCSVYFAQFKYESQNNAESADSNYNLIPNKQINML